MSLSVPRSMPTTPVVPDRNATIGLTMAATLVVVAVAAAIAVRLIEAIGSATANEVFVLAAAVVGLTLAVGLGVLAGREAVPVGPTPGDPHAR